MENCVQGLVYQAPAAWVHYEVVDSEEVHSEDGFINVGHHEGPGKLSSKPEVEAEDTNAVGSDGGVVGC